MPRRDRPQQQAIEATETIKTIEANTAMTEPKDSLIEYPSDFPIKVMGPMHDDFTQTITELVLLHDAEFHAGKIEMRPSSGGNYISLTVTVRATSREQLDNLYRALSSHPMVKFVL
jgi:putative lipoic acid-binding regulatory protein